MKIKCWALVSFSFALVCGAYVKKETSSMNSLPSVGRHSRTVQSVGRSCFGSAQSPWTKGVLRVKHLKVNLVVRLFLEKKKQVAFIRSFSPIFKKPSKINGTQSLTICFYVLLNQCVILLNNSRCHSKHTCRDGGSGGDQTYALTIRASL